MGGARKERQWKKWAPLLVLLLFSNFAHAESGHISAGVVDITTITATVDGVLVQDGGNVERIEMMVGDTWTVFY